MSSVVVIVPTGKESAFFAERGIEARHCGVGMAECAAATAHLIVEDKPDLVILAGIAGACSDDMKIGETVVVTSETIADLGRLSAGETKADRGEFTPLYQKTYSATVVPRGFRNVRSNTVNTAGGRNADSESVSDPDRPRESVGIENMEGAAFFAVCERFGVPAMEVRTVSNRVGEPIGAENMDIAVRRLALDLKKILASCV